MGKQVVTPLDQFLGNGTRVCTHVTVFLSSLGLHPTQWQPEL